MSKELKKFNSKYKTEITEDIVELDVLGKKIGDEGLKILCDVKFSKIQQFLLEENDISNIDILAKNHLGKNLIALDLSTNKISSINVLAKLNFPALNHLFLNSNQIPSIDILAKVNFPNLKELNLSSNKIPSIDIFASVKFPQLKQLDLSKNEIKSIDVLAKANFQNLEELILDQNKISSIDVLGKVKYEKLKKLKLDKNNLKSIDILLSIPFNKLNYFSIGDDTLGDKVDCLTKIKFGELEDIYLYLNDSIDREAKKIQDIATYFEDKGITFNFISCDDDNDLNIDNDDLNVGGGKTNDNGVLDVLLDLDKDD